MSLCSSGEEGISREQSADLGVANGERKGMGGRALGRGRERGLLFEEGGVRNTDDSATDSAGVGVENLSITFRRW